MRPALDITKRHIVWLLILLPLRSLAQDVPESAWVQTIVTDFSPDGSANYYVDPRTIIENGGEAQAEPKWIAFDSVSVELRTHALQIAGANPVDITKLISCTEGSGLIPLPNQALIPDSLYSDSECTELGTYTGLILGQFETHVAEKTGDRSALTVLVLQVTPTSQLRYRVVLAQKDDGVWNIADKNFLGGSIE